MIDPTRSYVVSASAGCGKTYQLSQRFLRLVAEGAHPGRILTVTFTKKAAAEMRERICADAYDLCHKPQESFGQKRSAVETGQSILQSIQQLRISTIDSLFSEWVQRYPVEALGLPAFPEKKFQLMESWDVQEIEDQAWDQICTAWEKSAKSTASQQALDSWIGENGYVALRHRCDALAKYRATADLRDDWFCLHRVGPESLSDLDRELRKLALVLPESFRQKIPSSPLSSLAELSGLLTKELAVPQRLQKGQEAACLMLQELAQLVDANIKCNELNTIGAAMVDFCQVYWSMVDALKQKRGWLDFSDLTRGSYRLMRSYPGIRFLIEQQIEHLMVDEFQDTSRLQWEVFRDLSRELLATSLGSVKRTVFFVGDIKQSIYGFRQADPKIMNEIPDALAGIEVASIQDSYRSSSLIMDYCNALFTEAIADFPRHQTAVNASGEAVVPDCAMIEILTNDDHPTSEDEARAIAEKIIDALQHPESYPVYCKKTKKFRPLRASDCALLYRFSRHAEVFAAELEKAGIAVRKEENRGFFELPEIIDTVALLRCIAYPADRLSRAVLARGGWGGCSEKEALTGEPQLWVDDLVSAARLGCPPPQILVRLMSHIDRASFGENALRNLDQLLQIVDEFSRRNGPSYVTLCQYLADKAQLNDIGPAADSGEVVQMMTMHKSKGLEFPMVALVATASAWETKDRYWSSGVHYLGTASEKPVYSAEYEKLCRIDADKEESLRLLYVAITRAKQYLWISGHKTKHDDHAFEKCVAALQSLGGLKVDRRQSHRVVDEAQAISYGKLPDVDPFRPPTTTLEPSRLKISTSTGGQGVAFGHEIHHQLECFVRHGLWDENEAFPTVRDYLERVTKSDAWKWLWKDVTEHQVEFPVLDLAKDHLRRLRLDLLIIKSEEAWIVDYKTSSDDYSEQLGRYREAVVKIYPEKRVRAFIFETTNCELIEIK